MLNAEENMAIIVEEIGPHPVYDTEGQHDEEFATLTFYAKGEAYARLRVHREDLAEDVQVGDQVKIVVAYKPGE